MDRVEDLGIRGLRRAEGAPGGGPLGTYGDNGVLLYAHRLVLVVLAPQEPHGGGVLPGAGVQKLALPRTIHESQEVPVFGVSVRDERYFGVLEDVPDA